MNNSRALLLILLMFCGFIGLVVKLFSIQVTNHDYYMNIALNQQNSKYKMRAERGLITDRNEEVLAYTENNISLFVDKRMLSKSEKDSTIRFFSKVFNKPKNHYASLIDNGSKNICLEKKVSKETLIKFNKFYVDALFVEEDFTRNYPYGSLASHLLGYVDLSCNGINGIEKQYNNLLVGRDGIKHIENDVLGRTVSVDETNTTKPVPGNNVKLTINKTYQTILEQELVEGLEKFKGDSATGIIIDPRTGEILALSSLPDFDPANYNKYELKYRRNRAITDPYEPGSIIKPMIMSMLIEEDLVKEDEMVNTENGDYYIRSTKISDTHAHPYLTVRGIIEESSNIGMAKLSSRIDETKFYKYLRDFGFGNSTGLDLPGESNGMLKKPKKYSKLSKPFISFGYEILATPIQLVSAFSALINGGNLMRPYIVKEVTDNSGHIITTNEPEKIRRIISTSTSNRIIDFMIGVVEEGTATNAKLDNVLVGGKTGTAQMLIDGSYSKREYNSSFIGFFPAEDPKVVCLVAVSSPSIGRYGGQVAAPIFKNVAKRIIDADLNLIPEEYKIERKKKYLDELLKEDNSQMPADIIKYSNLGEEQKRNITNTKYDKNIMPNLLNLSVREARVVLSELGLKFKLVGTGKVTEQSIRPNTPLDEGTVCLVKCETKKPSNLRLN